MSCASTRQPRSLRLLRTAIALQTLLLAGLASAERGDSLNVTSLQGVSPMEKTDSDYEPLSGGRLSANINQLEKENKELTEEKAGLLGRILNLRRERQALQEAIRNESEVLKTLQFQKDHAEKKISRAEVQLMTLSAQYESQVHAAEVALACLSGICKGEQLKIWDTWAWQGYQSPEDLVKAEEEPTDTDDLRDVKQHKDFGSEEEEDSNETFATDGVDDQSGSADDNETHGTEIPVQNVTPGKTVPVFVGTKKVMEVSPKEKVQVEEDAGEKTIRVVPSDKEQVDEEEKEFEKEFEKEQAKPVLDGKWKHRQDANDVVEEIVNNEEIRWSAGKDPSKFTWVSNSKIALPLEGKTFEGTIHGKGDNLRIRWNDPDDPIWYKA